MLVAVQGCYRLEATKQQVDYMQEVAMRWEAAQWPVE